MANRQRIIALLALLPLACGDDVGQDGGSSGGGTDGTDGTEIGEDAETGTSAGTDTGDGDGDPTGDGDGDPTGDGDGDGDPTGDGDGDGDGDPPGDGDGDGDPPGDGDGDGDPPGDGDGDGDPPGDGDGDNEEQCPLALALVPCDSDNDAFHAMGLNCGDAPEGVPITNAVFTAADNSSWKVANQFGSSGDWSAREGEKLLIISTGELTNPNGQGAVILGAGVAQGGDDNGNADGVANLPDPINPVDGSGGVPFEDCDGQNDCSDTLQAQWALGGQEANDLLWFSFDLEVPADANGYEFDFAFFSAEYPEYVGSMYNDVFVVWSTSETYTGNVTFIDGQPLTITALANSIAFEGNDPELAGTGVDGIDGFGFPFPMEPIGGGTGWFAASGSAAPGEQFTLAWAVFDMGDSVYDTTVVLDAFRWDCEGCIPNEVDGCGVEPQPQ